jgi:hypothetical protein
VRRREVRSAAAARVREETREREKEREVRASASSRDPFGRKTGWLAASQERQTMTTTTTTTDAPLLAAVRDAGDVRRDHGDILAVGSQACERRGA